MDSLWPGPYTVTVLFELHRRTNYFIRQAEGEEIRIEFEASTKDVNRLMVNSQDLKTGVVRIQPGRHQHDGKEILGVLSYEKPFSLDFDEHVSWSLEELLKMKADHIKEHGTKEPFPHERLISPASFSVLLVVEEKIFNEILRSDEANSDFSLNLTLAPKDELSLRREDDVADIDFVWWDAEKERQIATDCFTLAMKTKAELPPVEPTEKGKGGLWKDTIESALNQSLSRIERTTTWCLLVLVALLFVLFFKT